MIGEKEIFEHHIPTCHSRDFVVGKVHKRMIHCLNVGCPLKAHCGFFKDLVCVILRLTKIYKV